ncbi:hypothetical protein K402DRAFT_135105 [Aulographum hederae CBS 113979]|uniref:Uncharacterized protein n=1 Tax=Aulographum hederae CBS 113979 TaxID=1176131 RepID=A0A6G1GUV3_9PEZI|nr:hypothetical protein K402DRAFT_135105 [Aulographum hederae CBS 113979]
MPPLPTPPLPHSPPHQTSSESDTCRKHPSPGKRCTCAPGPAALHSDLIISTTHTLHLTRRTQATQTMPHPHSVVNTRLVPSPKPIPIAVHTLVYSSATFHRLLSAPPPVVCSSPASPSTDWTLGLPRTPVPAVPGVPFVNGSMHALCDMCKGVADIRRMERDGACESKLRCTRLSNQ